MRTHRPATSTTRALGIIIGLYLLLMGWFQLNAAEQLKQILSDGGVLSSLAYIILGILLVLPGCHIRSPQLWWPLFSLLSAFTITPVVMTLILIMAHLFSPESTSPTWQPAFGFTLASTFLAAQSWAVWKLRNPTPVKPSISIPPCSVS